MARRNKTPLSETQQRSRKIVLVIGSVVVVVASVIGLAIGASLQSEDVAPDPTSEPGTAATDKPAPPAPPAPAGSVVDSSVTKLGWLPEPITSNPADYAEEAARAITTYDTTLATREQFLDHLATWHTEDPRYASAADRAEVLQNKLGLLRNRIIVPDKEWTRQALVKTVVTAEVEGPLKIDYDLLSATTEEIDGLIADGYHEATVDLVITYTSIEPSTGDRVSYDNRVTVSMQLQCGNSVPVAGSGQSPADCKLIRFFAEPML